MKRKIGEIFEFNDEWYQCVEGDICTDCAFAKKHCNRNPLFGAIGSCSYYRNDATSVIFKKLEKVGEPFYRRWTLEGNNKLMQRYKIYTTPLITIDKQKVFYNLTDDLLEIEIKQNQEDMKENKIQHYDCFFDRKPSKSGLKPFSLEAAKAGKPVCTRDCRKARIICFDANGSNSQQIIALITDENGFETSYSFTNEGRWTKEVESVHDLMMLPEKKEGWVNIYALNTCYSSKEEAEANIDRDYEHEYVRTVKISWEE